MLISDMNFNDLIVCPKCFGSLTDREDECFCMKCGTQFPVYRGIPDFRCIDPVFKSSKQEIRIRDALMEAYAGASFEELIEIRYSHSEGCPDDLCKKQKAFELSYEQKGNSRSFQINKSLKDEGKKLSGNELFLDIGCGSGTAVPWIMKGFERGIGIDYSIVDLIVGKKFLEEKNINNVTLICADARQLPFESEVFDFVNSTDVIEHILPGQDRFVTEVRRVLKDGGAFYFNSPNRYNIFTPEPHVQVRFVGFMPRRWMNGYVRMMKGVHYNTIRPLSLKDVHSIVISTFGKNYELSGPFVDFDGPATDFKRKVIIKFPFLLKFINSFFMYFTTNYNVLAFKQPTEH